MTGANNILVERAVAARTALNLSRILLQSAPNTYLRASYVRLLNNMPTKNLNYSL